MNAARPEVLVDVDGSHVSPRTFPSGLVDERLEVGQEVALVEERRELAHLGAERVGARAEPGATKVAGLRGEEQLDRDDARPELDHLVEPSRRERRHRHPILEPLGLGRRDVLERDGLCEEPRLGGERLGCDPELAERALGDAGPLPSPSGSPVSGACRSFTARSRGARDHGCEREPGEVERGSRTAGSRSCRPRSPAPRRSATSGFDWAALSSIAIWRTDEVERVSRTTVHVRRASGS